jgi:hypothetical protein
MKERYRDKKGNFILRKTSLKIPNGYLEAANWNRTDYATIKGKWQQQQKNTNTQSTTWKPNDWETRTTIKEVWIQAHSKRKKFLFH